MATFFIPHPFGCRLTNLTIDGGNPVGRRLESTDSQRHELLASGAADELLKQSKTIAPGTIEGCERILKAKGWVAASMVSVGGGVALYHVNCNRGSAWIEGQGTTILQAWQQAVKQAE